MTVGRRNLSAPDAALIGRIAAALKTDESFIEKDWHAVRALAVIAGIQQEGVRAVFSGGTSLSKGWGLIKRFSEDIDFKVGVKAPSKNAVSKAGKVFRTKVLEAMAANGFQLTEEPFVRHGGLFFRASFEYGAAYKMAAGLRRGLQVEITFMETAREPTSRPLRSLVAEAQKAAYEIEGLLCVDPIETAADKLSALAWRSHSRDRNDPDDDPTVVRHLHDLAALASMTEDNFEFAALVLQILDADAPRAKDPAIGGIGLLNRMLPKVTTDALWRAEYEKFVSEVSYAPPDELIDFDTAVARCQRIVDFVASRHAAIAAANALLQNSNRPTLGGLSIKELINDGRR